MLWMAVTADRFELPLCVEESATLFGKKIAYYGINSAC